MGHLIPKWHLVHFVIWSNSSASPACWAFSETNQLRWVTNNGGYEWPILQHSANQGTGQIVCEINCSKQTKPEIAANSNAHLIDPDLRWIGANNQIVQNHILWCIVPHQFVKLILTKVGPIQSKHYKNFFERVVRLCIPSFTFYRIDPRT